MDIEKLFNGDMLKNLGSIQQQTQQIKELLQNTKDTGTSGAGMVSLTLNGLYDMVDIKLDPICVDKRDIKMLEDLIIAAHNDAKEKVTLKAKQMGHGMLSSIAPLTTKGNN